MSQQDLSMVPGKEHYAARYVRGGRLFSYAHQMNAVLEHEPRTVLEVGPGPGMVTAALRAIGVKVTTVDVQPELHPDVVASVTDLPFEDDSFDVSLCSQVLEHLPFEEFLPAVRELVRVSSAAVVLSVPDARSCWEVRGRLPKCRPFRLTVNCARKVRPERIHRSWERSGHYWEIGYPGYPQSRLMFAMRETGWEVGRTWRPSDMTYHWFALLTPPSEESL